MYISATPVSTSIVPHESGVARSIEMQEGTADQSDRSSWASELDVAELTLSVGGGQSNVDTLRRENVAAAPLAATVPASDAQKRILVRRALRLAIVLARKAYPDHADVVHALVRIAIAGAGHALHLRHRQHRHGLGSILEPSAPWMVSRVGTHWPTMIRPELRIGELPVGDLG